MKNIIYYNNVFTKSEKEISYYLKNLSEIEFKSNLKYLINNINIFVEKEKKQDFKYFLLINLLKDKPSCAEFLYQEYNFFDIKINSTIFSYCLNCKEKIFNELLEIAVKEKIDFLFSYRDLMSNMIKYKNYGDYIDNDYYKIEKLINKDENIAPSLILNIYFINNKKLINILENRLEKYSFEKIKNTFIGLDKINLEIPNKILYVSSYNGDEKEKLLKIKNEFQIKYEKKLLNSVLEEQPIEKVKKFKI